METKIITELLKVEVPETTTNNQLLEKAELINSFLQKQDGFIDAELVKALEGNTWYFIYHIENIEKLKVVGEKLRNSRLFDELMPHIVKGSMAVTFYQSIRKW